MYYANFILNKKGPLAKIWLAAHWDKKLTKAQIYETNIESTIEAILEPQMKLALRTSGHLLLGICRIYSRKVKYLLADCNEAFVKIKLAFRPGLIDLPKEKQQAAAEAITLPEKFPEMLVNFPEINMDMDMELGLGPKSMGALATQMARIEDITLKEDFGSTAMVTMQDDDFGDMGMAGVASFGAMDTFMFSDVERGRHAADSIIDQDVDPNAAAAGGAADKSELQKSNLKDITAMDLGELEPNMVSEKATEDTIMHDMQDIDTNDIDMSTGGKAPVVPTLFDEQPTVNADEATVGGAADGKTNQEDKEDGNRTIVEKQIRNRRRRKLVVDEVKEIDSATMKAQLSDTSSILGTLELAPPTRKLMLLKEIGGVDKLYCMTGRIVHNKAISKLYARNMVTKSLADITNTLKEKPRNAADDHTKVLPLADSYIEAHEGSRIGAIDIGGRDASHRGGEDDYDNNFGPASIYNQNLEDMLDNPQAEITPGRIKPSGSDSDSDSADELDQEGKSAKKATHKKRSYRKSLNTTLTTSLKDQTLRDELDEETAGDSTQDPGRNLTKRAKTMVSLLNRSFNKQDNVSFFELIRRNGKKSVVQKFYSLLVLKKHEIIDVYQAETFGDVVISKGEKFETFVQS